VLFSYCLEKYKSKSALYAAGESLVKSRAVKIARIMCSDAVANRLAMVFLQTTPSNGASKNSQSIF